MFFSPFQSMDSVWKPCLLGVLTELGLNHFSFTFSFLIFKDQQNLVIAKILDKGRRKSKMTSNSEGLGISNAY